MATMFDSLDDLTEQQRTTIKQRYRFLMNEYRRRGLFYSILFYVLRITMTVGSLAVPALLSLKTREEEEALLYWFTWGISLAVTTSNGLTTLFKLDKRYFMLHGVAERLRTETWQFLSLSGRYSGHYGGHKPSHRNQYVYYTTRVEKIRMKHIEEEFVRQADLAEGKITSAQPGPVDGSGPQGGATKALNSSTAVPTPPDQATLVPSPPGTASVANASRRDSESTVRSDSDAIVIMADPQEARETNQHTIQMPVRQLSEDGCEQQPVLPVTSFPPVQGQSVVRL